MDNELRYLLHSHYPFSIIHYPLLEVESESDLNAET